MNIIIDVTRLVRRLIKGRTLTGIDRVGMAYVQHYGPNAQALVRWCGRSWVLPHAQSHALFLWIISPNKTYTAIRLIATGLLTRANIKKNVDNFLLNTGHISLGQLDYPRIMRMFNVKPIFFVHDLIPITHPEYCGAGEDRRHRKKMQDVFSLAHGVITNSAATLHDLTHFSKQTQLRMPAAQPALLAPGLLLQSSPGPRPMNKPYFVILSTLEPRKNHTFLLQLWQRLVQHWGKQQTPHLFIIGQRGWECENVI